MISVLPKPPPFPCLCPHSQSKMISLYYRLQSGAVNTLQLGHTHSRGMHLNWYICNVTFNYRVFSIHRATATKSATVHAFSRVVSLLTVRLTIEVSYLVASRTIAWPRTRKVQMSGLVAWTEVFLSATRLFFLFVSGFCLQQKCAAPACSHLICLLCNTQFQAAAKAR